MSARFTAVLQVLLLTSAMGCAQSVSNARNDAGDGAVTDASTFASCETAVEGSACMPNGHGCSVGCEDRCARCKVRECVEGRWQQVDVPPFRCGGEIDAGVQGDAGVNPDGWIEPPVDAAFTPSAMAQVLISAQDDVSMGRMILVRGDGAVFYWSRPRFRSVEPLDFGSAVRMPSVSREQVAVLFALWGQLDRSQLPHRNRGSFCGTGLFVRPCDNCAEQVLGWGYEPDVLPELGPLFRWYRENLRLRPDDVLPDRYCTR